MSQARSAVGSLPVFEKKQQAGYPTCFTVTSDRTFFFRLSITKKIENFMAIERKIFQNATV
ncbi:hypothetical protein OUZ56_013721 [Daphnia magna]|uniref:Uncharacterized protein n=1 Tax=Daphnia magna TaxID=35525 RepID=A0ABQ9Z6Q1_9CRUS|nr:hypothetical protein OUZ56_013721 [Daphnia magna]